MNRIVITSILLLLVCPANAQPRVDGQQQFKVLKSSAIVTNIVGWAYDESSEKWAGYYNAIDDVYRGNNKVPIRMTTDNLSCCDNIVSLQFKKVAYRDSIYYALIKVYWHSGFEYPSIIEGWYRIKNRKVILYEPEEYRKLFNLSSEITTLNQYYHSSICSFSSCTVNDQLREIFKYDNFTRSEYDWKWYFKREDASTIRFSDDYKNKKLSKYFELKQRDWKMLLIE